ncbi:MAG TPA: peptide chain release factor-like protein [Phycisphaerales bacterium]|nr:peptide chain release factor-like protein [Phycisphaerales bacterium]
MDEDALLAQCEMTKGRTRGPGGQHRNKVETMVELRHTPTGISAHAGERRMVTENKRVALFRLRLRLAVDHRCPVPSGEVGSDLWRSRRKSPERGPGASPAARLHSGGRIVCSPEHHDFPALLAEALDVIAAAGWDVAKAALRLDVSPTQLVKLLKDHRPALTRLNAERQERGLHGLK